MISPKLKKHICTNESVLLWILDRFVYCKMVLKQDEKFFLLRNNLSPKEQNTTQLDQWAEEREK